MCESNAKAGSTSVRKSCHRNLAHTPTVVEASRCDASPAVSHNGTTVAGKQAANYSLKNNWRAAFVAIAIGASMGCGNTGVGAMDGGRDVMGDVVEYGVNFRPPNNRYCPQLQASTMPLQTSHFLISLCSSDTPNSTTCPNGTGFCVPVERFSPDLESYARDNRLPKICASVVGALDIPRCDSEAQPGCGDGTFCVYARHRITGDVWPMCVPYPCN